MTHAPVIRPVQPSDFEAWKPLWDGYNAFYGREGDTALPADVTHSTWQRFFDPYEPLFALVAEDQGQLLGLVHCVYQRSTLLAGPNCYLQDLFTAPAARKRGVGSALIQAVYDKARADGCKRVYWHTQADNATARALYNQVAVDTGFVVYHQLL